MTDSATPQDTAAPAEGPVLPEETDGPAVEETHGPAVGETHGPAVGDSAAAAPEDGERRALRARRRRAAVRWSAAVVVCALAGTGTALAVTAQERTDLPGLATPKDGRYTFPALVLPQLPTGKAVPKENTNRHAAELRALLLPTPQEAGGSLTPAAAPATGGSPSATPSLSPSSTASAASATASGTPSAMRLPGGGAHQRARRLRRHDRRVERPGSAPGHAAAVRLSRCRRPGVDGRRRYPDADPAAVLRFPCRGVAALRPAPHPGRTEGRTGLAQWRHHGLGHGSRRRTHHP